MIHDTLLFFKKPSYEIAKNSSFKDKIVTFIVICGIMYVFIIVSLVASKLIDILASSTSIGDLLLKSQNKKLFANNIHYGIFYVLLLGPFIEEVIYRLPLSLKKRDLAISSIVYCFILVGDKFRNFNIYSFGTWSKYIAILLVITVIYNLKQEFIDKIKSKYYGYFFYAISISFGLIHIQNFYKILPTDLLWTAPFFVLPQIFLGIFTGYIRIKNGFLWGLLMHIVFNIPTVLLYILKNYN